MLNRNAFKPSLIILAGLMALAAGLPMSVAAFQAQAAPLPQSVGEGQTLFEQKCAACHTIGGGALVGPDLKGVASRRDPNWLAQWIAAPDKMIAAGDPIAAQILKQYNNVAMPNLGLSSTQVQAVIAYIAAQSGQAAPSPGAPNLPPGDASRGRQLFVGLSHQQNDGPPCYSCHNVAGIAPLGGGAMGPDLTAAVAKYGGATGMAAVLGNIPFPTMQPIFANRPLTPQEQADLIAFLQTASQQQPANYLPAVLGLTVIGLLGVGVLVQLVWWRRLRNVRRSLVRSAK